MKGFPAFIKSLIFALIITASAFSQTPKPAATKIVTIDTSVFCDKEKGIREVIAAREKLDAEMKPKKDELAILEEKIKKLDKFRVALKEFPQGDYFSFEQTTDLYEKLIVEYIQKRAETKSLYEQRKTEIFADIYQRIGDTIKQFAKEKGYVIILDKSKDNSSVIIEGETFDVTEDFIKYYNENSVK